MRIRRIAVENFRKLRDPVEIDGLQPGLNLIVGDNEEGKSTLLKAVQAAFFDKHSMTGKAVEAMLPFGSQVQPRVAVEFEVGKASYSLHKGFNLSRFAKLGNAKGSWANAYAEEKLKEILGFTPPNAGPAQDKNRGLSGPLWVEQGRAYETLKLNEDTKKALDEAIENEVDTAIAGDDGDSLLAAVRSEFEKYYTPVTNQERALLTNQRGSVQSLKEEIKSLKEKKEQHDEKLDNLEEIKRELPRLQDEVRRLQQKIDAITAGITKIDKMREKIGIAKADLVTAEAKLREDNGLLTTRNTQKKGISQEQKKFREMKQDFLVLDEQRRNAKGKRDRAKKELDQVRLECKRAKLKVERDKLTQAEGIAAGIAKNKKAIEEISLTGDDVDELKKLEDELNVQRATLEAMSTTLVFSPSGNQSVSANGEKIKVKEPCRITEKALFKLEGFGELEVTPGGDEEDIGNCRSSVMGMQRKLNDSLESLGYISVKVASEAWGRKAGLLQEIEIAEAKLNGLAPAGLQDLRSSITRLREDLPQETTDSKAPVLSVDEAEIKQRNAQVELEEASRIFAEIERNWNVENVAIGLLKESIAQLQGNLERDRELKSDDVLEKSARKAQRAHEEHQRRLNKLNAKLEKLNPVSTGEKLLRKEEHLERLQRSFNQKNDQKTSLEGELRGLGQLGLGEEIARRHRKVKDAQIELQRQELNAGAWKLLKHTLEKAQQEARVPLTPLMQRLEPYIQMVFPDAKLHLNEDSLEIDELHREHSKEPFPSLSIGTREQVAVLVRLAMADMLREQGKPVMLILDDPLVNSDDGRFNNMAGALRKAAENLQILILTCHEDRYRSLGADTVRRMEPKKQESIADLLAMPNADGIDFEPARLSGDLCRPADLS